MDQGTVSHLDGRDKKQQQTGDHIITQAEKGQSSHNWNVRAYSDGNPSNAQGGRGLQEFATD